MLLINEISSKNVNSINSKKNNEKRYAKYGIKIYKKLI
jgi:hypothetical protein